MADEFYGMVSPEILNQGDIIENLPWGVIMAPTTICRPDDRKLPAGKAAFYADTSLIARPPLPWTTYNPEHIHAEAKNGLGLVVWHGCQIDKWKNEHASGGRDRTDKAFVGVAPILPLTVFGPESQAKIREGRRPAYFPLPAFAVGDRMIPDSYVDLRHIWPVRQNVLSDRLATLSDRARESLYRHLFTFLTRASIADATCPKCGCDVPLKLTEDDEEQT